MTRLKESLETLDLSNAQSLNEFKSDIKAAYAARRYAEKQSGHHDASKHETVPNKKGEGNTKYGHSTTPGKDARQQAKAINTAHSVTLNDKGKATSGNAYNQSGNEDHKHDRSEVKTAAQKKEIDRWNRDEAKRYEKGNKAQSIARGVNKAKSAVGMKVDKSSRGAGRKVADANNHVMEAAKEAIEEFYTENGYEFSDYEKGYASMFIDSMF